jgi:hypothetical protein
MWRYPVRYALGVLLENLVERIQVILINYALVE